MPLLACLSGSRLLSSLRDGGRRLAGPIGCGVLCWGMAADLPAQELSVQAGTTASADLEHLSYAWQIDYRQYFLPEFAASFDWINEGHMLYHEPDGIAIEGWYCLPLEGDRLTLSVGAGPYLFFDTELPPGHGTIDTHGVAPIFSGSLTGYFSERWFWRVTINRINPPTNDIKVDTADLGVGYWLGRAGGPEDGRKLDFGGDPDEGPYAADNTVTAYLGWRTSNTRLNRQTAAVAAEYRRGLMKHLDATISYVYEGDPAVASRSGLGGQLWAVERFPSRWGLSIGMGFGGYFYLDKNTPPLHQNPGAVGGLVSPMLAKQIGSGPWSVRLVWNRIITNDDRDSDAWMLGPSYSWR